MFFIKTTQNTEVNDIKLNKKAVKYFGTENAYFNIYPYLREFITNMSQRMRLSPVVLPLLKPHHMPTLKVKTNKNGKTSKTKNAKEK